VSNRKSSTQAGLASTLAAEMRTVCGKLKRRLREHGGRDDLTPSQISVLLRLEKDGSATVSSLARTEGMRPQSMSAVVTPLQEAGLVRGAPDPGDGRQTLMSLTPKCLKLLQEGRAARQDWLTATISQKLSAQSRRSFSRHSNCLRVLLRIEHAVFCSYLYPFRSRKKRRYAL
jgi:DNA-binding MarR family transcriptional regulator